MNSPFLTDAEVAFMCEPLTQHAAQVRHLRNVLGLRVRLRPNGKPLVLRADVEAQAPSTRPAPEKPDVNALLSHTRRAA